MEKGAGMIVYYTGTGNSRRAAQLLAHRLQEDLIDAFPYLKNNEKLALHSDKPWIFTAPTYGWQLPHVFRDLILQADLQGSKDAYFAMDTTDCKYYRADIYDVTGDYIFAVGNPIWNE